MRIVAGRFRGSRLVAPEGQATRPTSDRVREALFNILAHSVDDFALKDARVLDLFAGSGALGFEALSRGASYALFIEQNPAARAAIRQNVESLGLTGDTKIWRRDATRLGPAGTMAAFDVLFADPPYDRGLGQTALASARDGGWLKPGAVCVLEDRADADVQPPDGFARIGRRVWGDTQAVFLRCVQPIKSPSWPGLSRPSTA